MRDSVKANPEPASIFFFRKTLFLSDLFKNLIMIGTFPFLALGKG